MKTIIAKAPAATPTISPGIAALEAQLALCLEEARKAMARAEAVRPEDDEYGHRADGAYGRAMRFMKMSAKLGLALGKLKGEHTSHIQIRRIETAEQQLHVEFPAPRPRLPGPASPPLDPDVETRLNQIYDDWVQARAATRGDVEEHHGDADDEDDEDNADNGNRNDGAARGEGDPPPVSQGSKARK
ncbi:MAG TPA: hypothetical protein VNU97_01995 [Rhizomicrobium sp.]|jgi:hypothetical protein|nr:hypothetical protein [Rhizomicrobium sp.]